MLFFVHIPFLGNINAGSPSFHLLLFLRALAPVPFAKGEGWLPLSGSLYSFCWKFPRDQKARWFFSTPQGINRIPVPSWAGMEHFPLWTSNV